MTSLTYAQTLTQTNKLIIDLRIWKGLRFRNRTVIWDNDVNGCWFESIKYITFPGLGSCQDEHGWLSSSWCSFPSVQLQNKTKLNAFLFFKNWMQSLVVLLACESVDQSTFCMKHGGFRLTELVLVDTHSDIPVGKILVYVSCQRQWVQPFLVLTLLYTTLTTGNVSSL